MPWISNLICCAMMALTTTMPNRASAAAPASATTINFEASARGEAINQIITRIERGYVRMDMREPIIARLRDGATTGRYATNDPVAFAKRVTNDLFAVTHDSHLYLRFDPAWNAAATAPPDPAGLQVENEIERKIARITNQGLTEMKVLPGNIRYLRIEGFAWIEGETPRAYDDAMRFLSGASAIIIDLRGNGGGYTQAVKYLTSHFLKPDTLYATFRSINAADEQQRTADYVPAGRIMHRPLYVIIDHASRSAAEQFAYNVKQFELGELIGETTAGASYTSDDTPVGSSFVLSVSTADAIQAIDPAGWEGTGIAPTVQASTTQALEIAQLHAIDCLLVTAQGLEKEQLTWARPLISAALNPVTLSERSLSRFAGKYGAASLRWENGALWLHRAERDPLKLRAMTRDGLFQVVCYDTVRVRVAAGTLEILYPDTRQNRIYPTN